MTAFAGVSIETSLVQQELADHIGFPFIPFYTFLAFLCVSVCSPTLLDISHFSSGDLCPLVIGGLIAHPLRLVVISSAACLFPLFNPVNFSVSTLNLMCCWYCWGLGSGLLLQIAMSSLFHPSLRYHREALCGNLPGCTSE